MSSSKIIRDLRLAHAWSQEHLAELATLSVRTIQRVENGEKPSLETLSALAAVFQVRVTDLSEMPQAGDAALDLQVHQATQRAIAKKRFYTALLRWCIVSCVLLLLHWLFLPQKQMWWLWVIAIWAGAMVWRGVRLWILDDWANAFYQKRIQQLLRKKN